MKKTLTLLVVLIALPLFITLMSMLFMPDMVPVHYDLHGAVTRWGSAYELLISPLFIAIIGITFILSTRKFYKKAEDRNAKILSRIFTILLVMLNAVNIALLIMTFMNVNTNTLEIAPSIARLIFVILGIIILSFGNLMPKIRRNGVLGFRTKWTTANDDNWFRAQRAGAKLFIVYGILIIVVGTVVPSEDIAIVACEALVVLMIPSCLLLSYALSKRDTRT